MRLDPVAVLVPTLEDTESDGVRKLVDTIEALTAGVNELVAIARSTTPPPSANISPVAAISLQGRSNLTATLSGTTSLDPDGSVATYGWRLGDATTASTSTVTHTYAAAGSYVIALTVTDNLGSPSVTATTTVTVTAPATTPASFVPRETKPNQTNVGAGILRARPTQVASTADGTISNGVLTITKNLKDRVVPYRLRTAAANLTVENCIITGDPNNKPTGSVYLFDNGSNIGTVIRYSTISPSYASPHHNAVGPRNLTVEFCDINHCVDGFVPAVNSSTNNVAYTARCNYVHDFLFYAPDNTHSPTPTTTAGGTTITGPWAGVGWDHADGCQVEQDAITGLNVYGNTIDARWADDNISTQPLPNAIKELSAFMLNGGRSLVIEDNWLDGGEYCINNADANVTGRIWRNRFGRKMAYKTRTDSSYFALMLAAAGIDSGDGTSNQNVWEDTGKPVARRQN